MGYLEKSPGVKISRKARAEWLSLKPGAHEDYVSWERFDAIRAMVRSKKLKAARLDQRLPGAGPRQTVNQVTIEELARSPASRNVAER
jgi:hypothetical protein